MSQKKIEEEIRDLSAAVTRIELKAESENRKMTSEELGLRAEMVGTIEELSKSLSIEKPLSMFQNRSFGGGGRTASGPFPTFGNFLQSVRDAAMPGAQTDPRLYQIRASASGANETTPSEGGFLVQKDFSNDLLRDVFNTAILAPRCRKTEISGNSNGIKLPGLDETSRADGSRHGGVRGYWIGEATQLTGSKPKFRIIEMSLKKVCCLVYATDELLQDSVALESYIRAVAPAELAFQLDDVILNGTGVQMPLGILNSGCLVSVAKETGQKAATIMAENVIAADARMIGTGASAVWLANKQTKKQLYCMSLSVGTGGVPVFQPASGLSGLPYPTLFGKPLLFVEQCSALGTVGDLIYADLANGYILAEKGGIASDMSIHVRFDYDESVFRFILRVDGQPVRAAALTPYKGSASATESHFVAIQSRT